MSSQTQYRFWLENTYFDEETKKELSAIKNSPDEIEERFYKDLEFGTGGLRGLLGAGTNRMNRYTVRKATQGVARYVRKRSGEAGGRGVVIAYDSRHMSSEFAWEAARVLAGNGIRAYVFDELRPTPELSFAVRHLHAAAGIVVTASHNPKEYNGYKVYGEDGAQMSLEGSRAVLDEIEALRDITDVRIAAREEALEQGLIRVIGREIDDAYVERIKTLRVHGGGIGPTAGEMKIVYTPLHGAGNQMVRRILKETGFENVLVVPEQELPDPDFSTVKYPNPEDRAAFDLAIRLAQKVNSDLIIGTDPDCDRVGVLVRNSSGEYVVLTGNQTGCLLMEYILSGKASRGELPGDGFVVKTIVTTELGRAIAKRFRVELVEVLTGFKFIGEKIRQLDENGNRRYLFGFEESYGYLAGTFARDKDGVVTSMLVAEMAAWYRARGLSLYEGLQELYRRYGYFREGIVSYTLQGKEGLQKIASAMETLRATQGTTFEGIGITAVRDYQKGIRRVCGEGRTEPLDLPESDVLYYELREGHWFCIRPSGTEPKIKIYFGVSAPSAEEADAALQKLRDSVLHVVKALLS